MSRSDNQKSPSGENRVLFAKSTVRFRRMKSCHGQTVRCRMQRKRCAKVASSFATYQQLSRNRPARAQSLEWSTTPERGKSAWSNDWQQEEVARVESWTTKEGETWGRHQVSVPRRRSRRRRVSKVSGLSSRPTGSQTLRNELIVYYSPFVKYVASRVSAGLPQHFEEEDLVSYGIIGLIDAIERFELDRNLRFETYAMPRIKGAIIDELRSIDWVPRSVRTMARAVEQAFARLEGHAAAHAERGRGRRRAGDVRGRLPQGAAQDLDGWHDGARRGAARR